jgi:hypothetical protein
MVGITRAVEVADVDAFLAEHKRLSGQAPLWSPGGWRSDLQAIWIVEDMHGAAIATLRFTCRKARNTYPSINLIFRNRPIWRVEIEDPPVRHRNPPWAASLGLPAFVEGSHEHAWHDNRAHVEMSPDWDIPARRPLHGQIKRLPAALASFADAANIELKPDQYLFDVPPQAEMELFS